MTTLAANTEKMLQLKLPVMLLLLCCSESAWGAVPPRLDVGEEVVISQNDTLTLRCEGDRPLSWHAASVTLTDDFAEITNNLHEHTSHPHVSTLTIAGTIVQDTGWFYCFYNDSESINLATDNDNVARTYLYVHEPGHIFVELGIPHSITVTTSEKLVLDCRTTLPNATVILTTNGEQLLPMPLSWDPRIGFVLRNLIVQDSGLYTCESKQPVQESAIYLVTVSSTQAQLPPPGIVTNPNQHYVVGHSFLLNCTVKYDNEVAFHWQQPNTQAVHGMDYNISKSEEQRGGANYKTSHLLVFNASLSDSGTYTCTISTPGKAQNDDSLTIKVQDTLATYINISSSGLSNITVKEGELLKWRAEVYSHPSDPILRYLYWDKTEVEEDDRVSTEHHEWDAASWLKIKNVTADDYGHYHLQGNTIDHQASDNTSILILVKSQARVRLQKMPELVMLGKTLSAECWAQGYPLPSVSWFFKACPSGPPSCPDHFSTIQVGQPKQHVQQPGNILVSHLAFPPPESGILQCFAKNSIGNHSSMNNVVISELGVALVLRHTGLNHSQQVQQGEEQMVVHVVENDDFHLLCAASDFLYANLTLSSDSDQLVNISETQYTRMRQITKAKVLLEDAGTYTCKAQPYNTDEPAHITKMKLVVKEEAALRFTSEANLRPEGDTVMVKGDTAFTINCTITGQPPPHLSWYKDGELLTNKSPFLDKDTYFSEDRQHLILNYVFDKHEGTYRCQAHNRLGSVEGSLTLTIPAPGLSTITKVLLALACVGMVVLAVVVFVLVKRVNTERRFRKSFRANELYLFEKGNVGELNPDCTAEEQADLLPYGKEWEVPRNNIKIGMQLGAGAFGRVIKAEVTGLEEDRPKTTVAIKMCKSQADQAQVRALALELKIMIHLGKHLNIVNLMGANTAHIGKGELWILVEFCRFGNLLIFMQKHRRDFINQINPTTGKIDPNHLVQDHGNPLSPLSPSSGGFPLTPITDHEGYLAPNSTTTKFTLSAPPNKRNTEIPKSAEEGQEMQEGVEGQQEGSGGSGGRQFNNPLYNLQRTVSSSSSHSQPHTPAHSTRLHSVGASSRAAAEEHLAINSDMTTMTSHTPLSPCDSTRLMGEGMDSKGNPFNYDLGAVPGVTAPFTTSDLLCWAWQVAQGMDYLASRKVLHGDLAARNLLLADHNVVKISDFGLSRDMYKKDVYMKMSDDLMPIKWMAVEAIRDRIFSVQSDVWAYGVTLWEIFSLGRVPYPDVEVNKDFLTYLEDGKRMNQPKYGNQEIYNLLLQCWHAEPMQRPSFSLAAEYLGAMMQPDRKGDYMTMNDPYLQMNELRFRNETDYLNMLSSPDFDNLTTRVDQEANDSGYINLQRMNEGEDPRPHSYLSMESAQQVQLSPGGARSHYLPMSASQGTPSPMADVFSPRPSEPLCKFNFEEAVSPRPLTQLQEEEEEEEEVEEEKEKSLNAEEVPEKSQEQQTLINGSRSPSPPASPQQQGEAAPHTADYVNFAARPQQPTYLNML